MTGQMTPRQFADAMRVMGIDDAAVADLGGGTGWPLGTLPGGRGVYVTNAADDGSDPAGPDDLMAAAVQAVMFESETENGPRWEDGRGLPFNEPLRFFSGHAGEVLAELGTWLAESRPCEECNADPGEKCRPFCTGHPSANSDL